MWMTTEEENNMFWNRKKRKHRESDDKTFDDIKANSASLQDFIEPIKEPDISEPIKAFLEASDRWDTDSRIDRSMYIRSAIDPETEMRLEVVGEVGFSVGLSAICLNHGWVTRDEAMAVWREIQGIEKKRHDVRIFEERQKWTEAYKNRGEVA